MTGTNLTKYQIAAVTMGIPCTGDDKLDNIIILGAKFRVCSQMVAENPHMSIEDIIKKAEQLLKSFK